MSLLLRLTCTLRVSAYLPDDKSGDWFYQALEGLTFVCAAREFLLWQDQHDQGLVAFNPNLWTYAALVVMMCALGASQCFGDLASKTLADQAFAGSVYLEVGAWFFQAVQMCSMPKEEVNLYFLVPAMGGVLCRMYFWDLAASELAPANPTPQQVNFKYALICSYLAMTALAIGSCAAGIIKRLGVRIPALPRRAAAPQAPAPVKVAKAAAGEVFPELREPLPAGCTHFVPISSVYANGILTVQYKPA